MTPRVLIVNKFYYPRGGDCVCTINLEQLLNAKGHTTAIYAMSYPDNNPTPWSPYFATQVTFSGSLSAQLKGLKRTMGLGDIKKSFNNILHQFKPHIVHLGNIHSYLSPILAQLAHQAGSRVVWTLHDYKLLCPAYACTRLGQPCELCFDNKRNVITHRCMKGSLAASATAWLEALRWNRHKLQQWVDTFICPSHFMYTKMTQGGFNPDKLTTLCNFVDPNKLATLSSHTTDTRTPYSICYIGRLSPEKGIDRLLHIASSLSHITFNIAGDGPLAPQLRELYQHHTNIHFLGHLDSDAVSHLLASSHASIIPSVWYENNPLGVIESLCAGTPVIGANIGGIPELITPHNGVTYTWHDPDHMKQAIVTATTRHWDNAHIAAIASQQFSPDTHYTKLMSIYNPTSTGNSGKTR